MCPLSRGLRCGRWGVSPQGMAYPPNSPINRQVKAPCWDVFSDILNPGMNCFRRREMHGVCSAWWDWKWLKGKAWTACGEKQVPAPTWGNFQKPCSLSPLSEKAKPTPPWIFHLLFHSFDKYLLSTCHVDRVTQLKIKRLILINQKSRAYLLWLLVVIYWATRHRRQGIQTSGEDFGVIIGVRGIWQGSCGR